MGSFTPSRRFPKLCQAVVTVDTEMAAQLIFETSLHELGHFVDREVIGKGLYFATDCNGSTPAAKCVAEISKVLKSDKAFRAWAQQADVVRANIVTWYVKWIWLGGIRRAATEVRKKREKLQYCLYHSNVKEWFANLYMLEVVRRTRPTGEYDQLVASLDLQQIQLAAYLELDPRAFRVRLGDASAQARIQVLFDELFRLIPLE